MGELKHILTFFPILCCLVCSSIYAQDVCVKKTSCSCEFSNGTGIDLSDSAKSSFFEAQIYKVSNGSYELSTYYYHPCIDAVPNVNASAGPYSCAVPLALCRRQDRMELLPNTSTKDTFQLKPGNYENMGTANLTSITSNGDAIIYGNPPSQTTVMLVCAETPDSLHVHSLDDPQHIVLAFYSRNACLRQIEVLGRSLGSTLLIILFSLVIFYLVLGVCTKKFLMGAQGIEVIPNLAFWSDLPNLVKDGWAFALNGFKLPPRGSGPMTSPDPNSYDSI